MAFLLTQEKIKVEFNILHSIQYNTFRYALSFWEDEKPCFVPVKNSEFCDPEDYINYRILVYENYSKDLFLSSLETAINEPHAHWEAPDFEGELNFSYTQENSIVNLSIEYILDPEVEFENGKKIPEVFDFTVTLENMTEFYNQLKNEFIENNSPYRLLIKKSDLNESPYSEEKKRIKRQKHFDTDKPILLIDYSCMDSASCKYLKMIDDKVFPVIHIRTDRKDAQEDYALKIRKRIKELYHDLPYVYEYEYPLNNNLILLQDSGIKDSYEQKGLNVFCCMERELTVVWFIEYCNKNWKNVPDVIDEIIQNSPRLRDLVMELDNDTDVVMPRM